MKIKFILMVSFISLFIHKHALSNQIFTVRHINEAASSGNKQWGEYFVSLVTLALEETKDTHGDFKLTPFPIPQIRQNRTFHELAQNNLDIVWSMSSIERENNPDYRPIRIPLLKGFLGYRIFIIRKDEQQIFDKINTVEQLKFLTAGQGRGWPDADILAHNEIPVITGASYEGLFNMLRRKRFDYFPRGIMEPWNEIKLRPEYELLIEKNLAIYYPAAMYFFVNVKNTVLYERLNQGLLKAIKNGNFEKNLIKHPFGKVIYNDANIHSRTVFSLENQLTPETKAVLSNKKFAHQFTK